MLETKKKKILFLITQSEFGGAQRFLLELATHLDTAKYESLVSSKPGELLDVLEDKHVTVQPLKWLRRDISPVYDLLGLWEIFRLLRRERPDVFFLLSSKAGFLGSLAGRWARTPRIVYRIGGWAFNDPQSWFLRKLYLTAEKISARWKDVIIVNSRHDAAQAERLGIKPREKLVTIYNGIDPASLQFFARDEARKRLNVPPSEKLIGCIANFYKTKGLPVLIEVMAEIHKTHPSVKLVIIGDGRERRHIESEIAKHDLQDVVLLAEHLPEAWKYLKAFDIFVLPSLKEGFPWVLLEAMAAEIPVIATSVGAIPEIVKNDENGMLVEPGNSEALQLAISELFNNASLRDKFASHAKETVEQKFKLDRMIQEVKNLL